MTCLPVSVPGMLFPYQESLPELHFDIALRLNVIHSGFAVVGLPNDEETSSELIEEFITNLRAGKTAVDACSECTGLQILGIPWATIRRKL